VKKQQQTKLLSSSLHVSDIIAQQQQ